VKRRLPHPLRRFRLPAVLLALVIVYGIAGYALIEGWNVLDSFYMTIITISTVGYKEVHALSNAGEIFTSTLIVVGVGTMLYGFGVFAETLTDNTFVAYRRERQLERALNQLRDHFIICGYGRIGTQIVAEFEEHKVLYAVIDQTEEALVRLRNEGRLHVEGDASSEEILTLAGIERARGLIAAVDSDERAVYITLAARALKPDLYILSRAGRPESIRRLELAGANRVLSPYQMAGHRMAELALRPALIDVLDTLHHRVSGITVDEMLVKPGMAAVGKTIAEAGLLSQTVAKLLAVQRHDGTVIINPDPGLRLDEGDLLVALGSEDQLYATSALLK
jgi:voltage-gated potassium channel